MGNRNEASTLEEAFAVSTSVASNRIASAVCVVASHTLPLNSRLLQELHESAFSFATLPPPTSFDSKLPTILSRYV
jgi:hypothetical protein